MVAVERGLVGRAVDGLRVLVRAVVAPWAGSRVELHVSNAATVVLARAAQGLGSEARPGMFGTPALSGRVRGERVFSWVRGGPGNAFRPAPVASVRPLDRESCVVVGRIRMFRFTRVFMAIWMTGALVAATQASYAAITTGDTTPLVVLVFPIFGLALTTVGWRLAAAQQRMLRDWLAATCETSTAPGAA